MLNEKASGDGHYFSAGAFAQQAEVLWGTPAIPTPAVAQGQALVGDATVGATVLVRSGVQAFVSDADQDDLPVTGSPCSLRCGLASRCGTQGRSASSTAPPSLGRSGSVSFPNCPECG
jgi:hypothetical protein